jgi:hypothetical protein
MPIVSLDSLNFCSLAWTCKFPPVKPTETSTWSCRTMKFKQMMLEDRVCFMTQICCKYKPCGRSQCIVANTSTILGTSAKPCGESCRQVRQDYQGFPPLTEHSLSLSVSLQRHYSPGWASASFLLNILKGINDINTAWEGVLVNCLNGVWC